MPTNATLSSEPVRRLTSREIAHILCSILAGMSRISPCEVKDLRGLMSGRAPVPAWYGAGTMTWQTAYLATVASFYAWCDRSEVDMAIEWMRGMVATGQDIAVALRVTSHDRAQG